MDEVIVVISGGIVRNVTLPNGTEVAADVYDYDTEGSDPEELETDAEGKNFRVYSI